MNPDPRFIRSQKKLYAAILKLAGEKPVSKITVSAVAAEADLHRSTVYEHAASPADLLRHAINAELDELFESHGVGVKEDATLESSIKILLEYMEKHETLFIRLQDQTGAELRDILRSHFMGSLQKVMETKKMSLPKTTLEIPEDTLRRFTAYSIADMHVGMYTAALQMPKQRSYEILSEMIRITSPAWWTWDQ